VSVVNYRVAENIAVLSLANPPVNALSRPLRQGLSEALGRALEDRAVAAVVLSGAGGLFGAGADLHELLSGLLLEAPLTRDLAAQIERADKPVIAAIEGIALGGAFELALACHWRIAARSARVGLPQVKLGLVRRRRSRRSLPAHRLRPRAHSSSDCSMSSRTRSCPRRSPSRPACCARSAPYAVPALRASTCAR
jgi:3-hydroxyacyl-CoA dehydrogenase